MDERLLHGLNEAQRHAVATPGAPLCILAGAGSGKTRVLTSRIASRILDGDADAAHVLALTFTRKAAGELRARLARLGVRDQVVAGTFHAVAYAQLRRRWADRGERTPALLDRKLRVIAPLLGGRQAAGGATVQPADVAAEIEWAKARMIPSSQYEVEAARFGRTPPLPGAVIASLYERYEAEKRRRGLVDFDDMLGLMARALTDDEEFAATQRWRFRHLFVDEFQDVNPVQFRLLRGWLGPRTDLCVVGDPNQAIYSWNGADPRLLDSFPRLFPGAEVVRLTENYRSTPQVLTAASAVLEQPAMSANRPDGPEPTIRSYATEVAEARGIAAALRREHGPTRPWSHMAVLTRTNAQALVFEEALSAAQIPFRIRGVGRFLDQPEVVEALAELDRAAGRMPFSARIVELEAMRTAAAAAAGGSAERTASLENLIRLARDYAALDGAASLPGFKAWLAATTRGDEPDAPTGDAVEVVTFHRAKGLEWPVVFVAGLERGLVPIGRAESPEALAEERRLLYVALSRAEEQLHCSWAERRTFGEASVGRSPSPWLALVAEAAAANRPSDVDDTSARAAARRALERERARLRSTSGSGPRTLRIVEGLGANPDPAVFDALKAWRSTAARAANVPAYVIFHDTTLAAVAEARPGDHDGLLGIPGLGPMKAARYGNDLLRVVAETASPAA